MRRLFSVLVALLVPLGAHASEAQEILIGFANPLSGPYAASGERNRRAFDLAVDRLNAEGGLLGRPIVGMSVDDKCGIEEAYIAAQKLVEADVSAVIGHLCSHSSLVAAGVYEIAGVPMITPDSTHPRLTEEGRSNVFRLVGRDDQQGRLAGDLLATRWRGREIAILHDGSIYGEGLADVTLRRLRRYGEHEAVLERYTPGLADYTALAAQLAEAGSQVIYIGGYGPDAARILLAAKKQIPDLQLVGGDGLGMPEFGAIAGRAADGTIFTARPDPAAMSGSGSLRFWLDDGRPGRRGGSGLGVYAALQVWSQAVERAGTTEGGPVAHMLHRARFDTILGPVAFDERGDLTRARWEWQVWQDGRFGPWEHHSAASR